jgi:hypothetical protein
MTKTETLAAAVENAVKCDDLDDACLIIQDAIGVETGDCAAAFFCGFETEDWQKTPTADRLVKMWKYVEAEVRDAMYYAEMRGK